VGQAEAFLALWLDTKIREERDRLPRRWAAIEQDLRSRNEDYTGHHVAMIIDVAEQVMDDLTTSYLHEVKSLTKRSGAIVAPDEKLRSFAKDIETAVMSRVPKMGALVTRRMTLFTRRFAELYQKLDDRLRLDTLRRALELSDSHPEPNLKGDGLASGDRKSSAQLKLPSDRRPPITEAALKAWFARMGSQIDNFTQAELLDRLRLENPGHKISEHRFRPFVSGRKRGPRTRQ